MNAYSLLIDLGGTDLKFGIAQGNRLIPESIQRISMPSFLDKRLGTISSKNFIQLIRKKIDEYLLEENAIQRILVSGQMGSWILTDSQGSPITEIVSWQSTLSTSDKILEFIYSKDYVSSLDALSGTGNEDWRGAPWRTVPTFIALLDKLPREIYFHTLISWTIWELSNRANHQVHLTDAAATGMFSQAKNAWMGDYGMFNTKVTFPQVSSVIHSVGVLEGTDIPIYVGIADQQASLYGVGVTLNSYVINAGTGGQVAQVVVKFGSKVGKARPYFDGTYLRTITHIPSGRHLNHLLEFIETEKDEILDWDWVWQRSGIEANKPLQMEIKDWEINRFLSYLNPSAPTGVIANELIEQLAQNFVFRLKSLGCKSGDTVFVAGGVATKLRCLRTKLESMGANIIDSQSHETTLEGLAKLTKNLTN